MPKIERRRTTVTLYQGTYEHAADENAGDGTLHTAQNAAKDGAHGRPGANLLSVVAVAAGALLIASVGAGGAVAGSLVTSADRA